MAHSASTARPGQWKRKGREVSASPPIVSQRQCRSVSLWGNHAPTPQPPTRRSIPKHTIRNRRDASSVSALPPEVSPGPNGHAHACKQRLCSVAWIGWQHRPGGRSQRDTLCFHPCKDSGCLFLLLISRSESSQTRDQVRAHRCGKQAGELPCSCHTCRPPDRTCRAIYRAATSSRDDIRRFRRDASYS